MRYYRLITLLSLTIISFSLSAQVSVEWTDLVGVNYNVTTGALTKTANTGWNNSGARSKNRLDAFENGKVTYTIDNLSVRKAIGLSTLNDDHRIRSIDYALVLINNRLFVYEHAVFIGRFSNFQVGDVFEVERSGGEILYKKNGNVFRQVSTNNEHILYVDVAIHTNGAIIQGTSASFYPEIEITKSKLDVVCGSGANGSIDITVNGGLAPYSYSWNNGETTEDLNNLDIGRYIVTVTDAQGKQAINSTNIQAPIVWKDKVGVNENGNNLTKNTGFGWNAGASSLNKLLANEKGFIQYTVDQVGVIKAFGLTLENTSNHYNTIDYGILFLFNFILVVEEGNIAGFYGQYNTGDKFRIVRQVNGTVKYKKNGDVIRQVTTNPNQELVGDVALFSSSATFNGIKSDFCNIEALTISYTKTNVNCNGTEEGSIDIDVVGGVPPYSYSWGNGENTEDISGLEIGQYSLTVTDDVGSSEVVTVDINTCVEWENIQEGIACNHEFIKPDAWLKLFGGNTNEYPGEIQKTSDGGFIISINVATGSNLPGHHGGNDAWIVKLDSDGNIEWSKMLGGTNNENLFYIEEDAEGNFICAGGTKSSDGDISLNKGDMDYWAVKLDNLGNILWSKTFGGSGSDKAEDVVVTSDGGYILAGQSWSADGDVSGGSTYNDYWVVKLDVDGNMLWEKSIGGTSFEGATSVIEQSNGDYFIVGLTYSGNVDFGGVALKGGGDLGAVKLDANGNILWVNVYGGTAQDGLRATSIEESDGIVIAARTASGDLDVPDNQGSNDYWLFKIDDVGNILWSKTYGGSGTDQFMDIRKTIDNQYLLTGYTYSNDGDVHNNHGGSDIWTIKVDSVGDTLWTQTYGSTGNDEGTSIVEDQSGDYLVLGVYSQIATAGGVSDDQACLKKVTALACEDWDIVASVDPDSPANSIGVSLNQLLSGEDGYIEYRIGQQGEDEIIGFTFYSNDHTIEQVEYGYRITSTTIELYEQDVQVQQLPSYAIGDVLHVGREGGNIVYYRNGSPLRTVSTDSSKILVAKTILSNAMRISIEVSFLKKSFYNHFKYADLRKKLDGSYYLFEGSTLRFKYIEKYRSGTLNYKIYEFANSLVLSPAVYSIPKRYGDNWISVNLCQFSYHANKFYVLEVTDEKGRKEYLRFTSNSQINCNPGGGTQNPQ